MYVHMHVCMYVCMCVCVYVCMCVCVYIYIYIYTCSYNSMLCYSSSYVMILYYVTYTGSVILCYWCDITIPMCGFRSSSRSSRNVSPFATLLVAGLGNPPNYATDMIQRPGANFQKAYYLYIPFIGVTVTRLLVLLLLLWLRLSVLYIYIYTCIHN